LKLPSVYDHVNFRRFLRAWYKAKKKQNPRFSHRLFARLAGLRSPSALAHVVSGRRNLSPSTVEAFTKALKLDEEEAVFFAALVQMDQGPTPRLRERARAEVTSTRLLRAARRRAAALDPALSRWQCAAVLELARHPRFRPQPRWIARHLRPAISPDEAAEVLALLTDRGLLREGGDGRLQAEAVVLTAGGASPHALTHHRELVDLAAAALTALPADARCFLGLTLSVPASALPALQREMDALARRALRLCVEARGQEPAATVCQLNLHLFPLTVRLR